MVLLHSPLPPLCVSPKREIVEEGSMVLLPLVDAIVAPVPRLATAAREGRSRPRGKGHFSRRADGEVDGDGRLATATNGGCGRRWMDRRPTGRRTTCRSFPLSSFLSGLELDWKNEEREGARDWRHAGRAPSLDISMASAVNLNG